MSSDSEANFWYSSSLVERILKEKRLTGAYGKIPGTELYLHMDSIRFKRGNDELVFDYAFETEDPMTYRSIRGFFWFYPQDIVERAMTQIAGDLFNLHLGGELHHRMTNLPDETVELLRAIVLCEYIGKQDRKFYVTSTWSKRPDIVSELLKLRSAYPDQDLRVIQKEKNKYTIIKKNRKIRYLCSNYLKWLVLVILLFVLIMCMNYLMR